jgi:hypothetical protein
MPALAMPRRYQPVRSSSRAGRVALAGLPARGRLPGRIRPACPGSRPASASAWRSRNSIWAFVLRSPSSAHLARGVMNGRIQLSLSVADRMVGR